MAASPATLHTSPLRRVLFAVHLWTGVVVGLYLLVVSLSGAALVFRIDMQRALHPQLLLPQDGGAGAQRPVAEVLRALQSRYPDSRISGVDAPSVNRPVYLAYVSDVSGFRSVLVDPVTAKILGELEDHVLISTLQRLHFNLLLGSSGRIVNGVGALCLLVMCISGAVIWWRGRGRWHRGLRVRARSGFAQFNRELHSATGFWTIVLLLMWAITALNFVFPKQFRAVVNSVSPLSASARELSDVAHAGITEPTWEALLAKAQQARPGEFVARVILPGKPDDAFQVWMAREQPTPMGADVTEPVHLDRYTGELIEPVQQGSSAGDVIMRWTAPLHVGHFAGNGARIAWLILGLAPSVLFVTGLLSWWRRGVRPAGTRNAAPADGTHRTAVP